MVKLLFKKQFMEVFKGYFYDSKKNKARSKGSIILWILFFAFIMIGVLGGMFTALSLSMCGPMVEAKAGWMYFLIMSGSAILVGAFGSIFTTYAGVYNAKDNDLLLSMPIPTRDIITARVLNVYIMGAMYSLVAIVPAMIVYWIVADRSATAIICGILLAILNTIIILVLSCLLGWVVAKISLKVKRKSFVSVFVSLLVIGLYYVGYFKAENAIKDMLLHADVYSEKLKGSAHWLYVFGRVGEGDWAAAGICTVIAVAALVLTVRILTKSFMSIVTSSGAVRKTVYVEKTAKEKSAFKALLGKEFARFTSSANYMLNCGLGVIFILVGAVALFWKGSLAVEMLNEVFGSMPGASYVLIVAGLMLMTSMSDMSAPAVSLEGKSIWIPQSLPVESKTVLRAKAAAHLIVSGIPMLLAIIAAIVVAKAGVVESILIFLVAAGCTIFSVVFASFMGIKMVNLKWTNEIVPIKQGGAVAITLFGCWGVAIVFGGLYMLLGYRIGARAYLGIWVVLFAVISWLLMHWIDTKGAKKFDYL